jgi:hypothetical protein
MPATQWDWPSDQPPSHSCSNGDDGMNMIAYVKLAFHNNPFPISWPPHSEIHPRLSKNALFWARFLRCALYFSYATSAPHQRMKRDLLLKVLI